MFSPRPKGGAIALKVCPVEHREGFPRGVPCRLCMVASWLWVGACGRRRWFRRGGAPAGCHEGVERLVVAAVSAGRRPPGRLRAWVCRGLLPGGRTPRGLEVGPSFQEGD